MKSTTLLAFVVLFITCQTYWDVGHMLTANIAKLRLQREDPQALRKFTQVITSINRLTDNRSHTFIEAAVWPDDLKESKYNMGLWSSWHFSDSPFVVDTVYPTINYTEAVMSSITAVQTTSEVLKKNVDRPSAQKALYARFLLHLAGDIHQPLHSVALFNKTLPKGDMGGNKQIVILPNGSQTNLHKVWDSGAYRFQNDTWKIIRPMNSQNQSELNEVALSFMRQFQDSVDQQARIIDPVVWAQESFLIAKDIVYPHIRRTKNLDQEYMNLAYQTSKRQCVKAGIRLANFISDIYKDESVAKSRAGIHKLTEPYRDHNTDFLSKAKSIIKKLFQKMDQVHPDCNSDPVQPMVEENDEI